MLWRISGLVFLLCSLAQAVVLVEFSRPEGIERLARSSHRADFGKLANYYRNQTDRISCGLATGAIVLNALRYGTDKAPFVDVPEKFMAQMPINPKTGMAYDPRIRMYTPDSFINPKSEAIKTLSRIYAEPVEGKRDPGLSLSDLARIFEEAHGLKVTKVHVGTPATGASSGTANPPLAQEEIQSIVSKMAKNLAEENNYVVVNYSRGALGQPGSGHISPVAAYDQVSDSFLVLDVNPSGGPWVWVAAADLVQAMNTTDSTMNRGFLLVSEP